MLVGPEHPVVLSVNAPKEVLVSPDCCYIDSLMFAAQVADVEGACQGLLGLEPY